MNFSVRIVCFILCGAGSGCEVLRASTLRAATLGGQGLAPCVWKLLSAGGIQDPAVSPGLITSYDAYTRQLSGVSARSARSACSPVVGDFTWHSEIFYSERRLHSIADEPTDPWTMTNQAQILPVNGGPARADSGHLGISSFSSPTIKMGGCSLYGHNLLCLELMIFSCVCTAGDRLWSGGCTFSPSSTAPSQPHPYIPERGLLNGHPLPLEGRRDTRSVTAIRGWCRRTSSAVTTALVAGFCSTFLPPVPVTQHAAKDWSSLPPPRIPTCGALSGREAWLLDAQCMPHISEEEGDLYGCKI